MPLAPGVYCFGVVGRQHGIAPADAMGDANAVWVFQIARRPSRDPPPPSALSMAARRAMCSSRRAVPQRSGQRRRSSAISSRSRASPCKPAHPCPAGPGETGTVTLASNSVSVCSLAGSHYSHNAHYPSLARRAVGWPLFTISLRSVWRASLYFIVFELFGPNDVSWTGTPAFRCSTVTVAGQWALDVSDNFTPSLVGTYRWIASYSCHAANAASATACNDANESVTISTRAAPSAPLPPFPHGP